MDYIVYLYKNPHPKKNELCLVLYSVAEGEDRAKISPICWLGENGDEVSQGLYGRALFQLPEGPEEEFHKHAILIGGLSLTDELAEKISAGKSEKIDLAPIRRGNLLKLLKEFGSLAVKSEGE